MLGALLLHATGAIASEETTAPPQSDPVVEPLMQPSPPPAPLPAPPPPPAALSLSEPKMIHERRPGLVVAGAAILLPTYLLQPLLAFGVTLSGIDGAPPGNYGQAGLLTLIPIIGPWVGPSSVGEPLDARLTVAWCGLELAAVAMIIAGEIGHDVPREPAESKVSLAPFVTPEARGLSLRLRW
jgi:hypothetical protein